MDTSTTQSPDSLGSPSSYASFLGNLLRKWDWWIYSRAVHSLRRMTLDNPGMAYLMELQIRDWNEKLSISPELRRATELFHESMRDHRHNNPSAGTAPESVTSNPVESHE